MKKNLDFILLLIGLVALAVLITFTALSKKRSTTVDVSSTTIEVATDIK